MKRLLFILLAFISFPGFSQESVKIQEIGLEVMSKNLGQMKWEEAEKACSDLGDGWRLPTLNQLKKVYKYKDRVVGFIEGRYWSSTLGSYITYWYVDSGDGSANHFHKNNLYYVRAVRDL